MKTLRRNASDAAARAAFGRAHRLVKPRAAYAVLLRALRDAERELGTVRANPPPANEVMKAERDNWIRALEVKIGMTRDALHERERELKMIDALFADAEERSQQLVDSYIRRMMARPPARRRASTEPPRAPFLPLTFLSAVCGFSVPAHQPPPPARDTADRAGERGEHPPGGRQALGHLVRGHDGPWADRPSRAPTHLSS